MKFKTTLSLVLLTVSVYFVFSNAYLYIDQHHLISLSFYWNNFLPGAFTYEFAHIGLKHLAGNMTLLLLVGLICEQKLRVKDYLAVYFGSGAFGAMTFAWLNPGVGLVGASACIAGLMVPAIVISPRRMFMGLILVALFSITLMMPFLGWFSESIHSTAVQEFQQAEQEHERILTEKQELLLHEAALNQTREQAEQKLKQGEITPEEYALITQNLSAQANLTLKQLVLKQEQEQKVLQEKNQTLKLKQNLEQGIARENRMVTSALVHAVGSVFGGVYLLVFRKDLLYDAVSDWSSKVRKCLARFS